MAAPNHRNIPAQLDELPIPPATLVIDMRTVPDDVLDTLQVEIENLTSVMDMKNVHHWRYLTDFLAFKKLPPISYEEAKEVEQSRSSTQQQTQRALGGRYYSGERRPMPGTYVDEENDRSFIEEIPNDELKRDIKECIQEIDAVRNKRLRAPGDVGKQGRVGRNAINPKVQVIFLTDAEDVDSLSSAATYSALLKRKYAIIENGGQLVLDTMIICLNHDNQSTPPRKLLSRLSWQGEWKHLDSLVLSEKYGANAAFISKSMQSYIAELLLYSLLISQPPMVRPPAPDPSTRFLPPPKTKEIRSLPPRTYLVGLAAIEHSAQWGRRLVNYSLATEAIEVLQDKPFDEQIKATRNAEAWLSDWRDLVRSAVPDNVPGDIATLQAFSHSKAIARPARQVFASTGLNLDTGQKTAKAIEEYTHEVALTYTMTIAEREATRKAIQERGGTQQVTLPPTLEDALGSIPQIHQEVSSWQNGPEHTPLVEAQAKAHSVLGGAEFFMGAQGSIQRARLQLRELSKAIAAFQSEHKQNAVNLRERRKVLEQAGQNGIDEVKKYSKRFPWFAGALHLKDFFAWLTLASLIVLSVILLIVTFSWLHYLGNLALPDLITVLDQSALGTSFYVTISGLLVLLDIFLVFRSLRRRVVSKKRSALWTQIYFVALLFGFALLSWIVAISAAALGSDPSGQALQFLIQQLQLPFVSTIIALVAGTIVLIEAVYYLFWFGRLRRARARIIKELRDQQEATSMAVCRYIADTLALELLKRAQLTDGNGGYGEYYRRIDQLSTKLDEIRGRTIEESQLATKRLTSRSNEKIGASIAAPKTPTLRVREELLSVEQLTLKGQQLGESLTQKREELKEFAEILLRVMGEEPPIVTNQEIRQRPFVEQQFGEQPFQESREQHDVQVLMSTAVALAVRMAVTPPRRNPVTPLKEHYEELDYRITGQFSGLKSLLDMMLTNVTASIRIQHDNEVELTSGPIESRSALATHSLALWAQMLWEHSHQDLQEMLGREGLMHYLKQNGYDPQTVRSLLATRTVISGRSMNVGQVGDLYMLMFPSVEGQRFFQEMHLEPHFISTPDAERLILLYIHQYVAPPQFIPDDRPDPDEADDASAPPTDATNGHVNGQVGVEGATAVKMENDKNA